MNVDMWIFFLDFPLVKSESLSYQLKILPSAVHSIYTNSDFWKTNMLLPVQTRLDGTWIAKVFVCV